jgi:hypothetical protein
MKFINISGVKFGRLIAVRRVENKGRHPQWLWRCDCGNEIIVASDHVKSGHTTSCGCVWAEKCIKHGHGHDAEGKQTRTYKAWVNMRSRVNPDIERYRERYYDRGIRVCVRWDKDFRAFLADMGECPPGKSLDRINNDGNYDPENCRWATAAQQSANQSRTKFAEIDGESLCIAEACRRLGVHPATVQHRMNLGMTAEDALARPVRKRTRKFSLETMVLEHGSEWMMY